MRIGSLFTGYGGLDQAVSAFTGATTAWVSDVDKGVNKILAHRYPDAPNLGDISTVDWSQVEPVDILTGGFPCQDVSTAGKRAGIRPGTRSGLWSHMCYGIDKLKPELVVIENVRGLLSADAHSDMEPCPWCVGDGQPQFALRALGAVLGDLADIGYDAKWCGLRAADVGACHGRFRVFVVAYPNGSRWGERRGGITVRQEHSSPERTRISVGLTLLPTPAVNDMGAGKTVDAWDAWTDDMQAKHGNGNGHGKSLSIETARATFGDYTPAIAQWEKVAGPAPQPTEPSKTGPRLSARFTEWMMGLPAGWVTDVPGITRNEALKACGNGVVPQQAFEALCRLL